MNEFLMFLNYIKNNAKHLSPWIIVIIVLYFAVFRTSDFLLMVSKIQGLFASAFSFASKGKIQNEINSRILKSSKKICKELEDVIPYEVKIKWVKASDRQQFLKSDKVVVCMDHKRTEIQNIVYALNDYVVNGLLPEATLYVDKDIMESSRLVMVRKLLLLAYKKGFGFYLQNILRGAMEDNEEIRKLVEQLVFLDENGLFIQVLLKEFMQKGKLIYGSVYDESFSQETRKFLQFINSIASREKGEETELSFYGNYFKVGIILVADYMTYNLHGKRAYTWRFMKNLKEGIESIYLLARGDAKKQIAKEVKEELKKNNISIQSAKEFEYIGRYNNGRDYKGICIAFDINCTDKEISA